MFGWKKKRGVEVHTKPRVRFVCEQDGAPERRLKEAIARELESNSDATRAYLVRVGYDDSNAHEVALCVVGSTDKALVARISSRFAEIFGKDMHLDIMFLTDEREAELKSVCAPFYNVV